MIYNIEISADNDKAVIKLIDSLVMSAKTYDETYVYVTACAAPDFESKTLEEVKEMLMDDLHDNKVRAAWLGDTDPRETHNFQEDINTAFTSNSLFETADVEEEEPNENALSRAETNTYLRRIADALDVVADYFDARYEEEFGNGNY